MASGPDQRSAELANLRRLLLELGPSGHSAELNAAMLRLGCADEHALILMLIDEATALRVAAP